MEASSSATSTAASSVVVVVVVAAVAATGAAATVEVAEGSLVSVAVTAFFAEEAFFAFTGADADADAEAACSTTTGAEVVVFDALVTTGVVVEVDFAILFLICLSFSYNLLEDLLFKRFNAKI